MTDDSQGENVRSRFEEQILKDAPRLKKSDRFTFACNPGVSCFGDCCGDVNIVLTPYDVLRLRTRLGLSSSDFLDRHSVIPFSKEQRLPIPLIRMNDDEKKSCPFLIDNKCSVYEDRPWACRMYPLGFASPAASATDQEEFYFLMEEKGCAGFLEQDEQSVAEWLVAQGIPEYDEMGERFKSLAFDDYFGKGKELNPKGMEMYWMATYDLDTFRRFIFDSSFLDRFVLEDELVESIRTDDTELMKFGLRWLEFALFGKKTMTLGDDAEKGRE